MNKTSIEIYKEFVDGIVELSPGVLSKWIVGGGWPKTEENLIINKVLSELTQEQKNVFAKIAQSARDGGIHDVLTYLTDQINMEGLEIAKKGIKMAVEPFDSGLNYDWVCRKEGDEWPDSE